MKKIILLSTYLLVSCSNTNDLQSNNQVDIIMVSESNNWYINGEVEYIDNVNNILDTRKRKLLYYFEGDTLINDLQYKKMYYKQFDSIFHQPLSGGLPQFNSIFYDIKYIAAMRQDDYSVYYIPENQSTEDLYANFDINLGDVLNYKWNHDNYRVTAIDSFQIGSNYITRYKLSNDQYFYEGIGASYGLFNAWQANANVGGFLTCFKLNNDKIGINEGFYSPENYCPEF
jgi:hypothetical protein